MHFAIICLCPDRQREHTEGVANQYRVCGINLFSQFVENVGIIKLSASMPAYNSDTVSKNRWMFEVLHKATPGNSQVGEVNIGTEWQICIFNRTVQAISNNCTALSDKYNGGLSQERPYFNRDMLEYGRFPFQSFVKSLR